MGRLEPCQKAGTHACGNVASHADICGWMSPAGYVAHVSDRPSPSALPPRRDAVMAHLARFRGLRTGDMYREANRLHDGEWRRFVKKRDAVMAALSAKERARADGEFRLVAALEERGFAGRANVIQRRLHRRFGLESEARGLEEVTEATNASRAERLSGGQLGAKRTRVYRFADLGEPISIAESGVFAHNRGQGHISFTLWEDLEFEGRPAVLSLGLTANITGRLTAVPYRSLAFSAPGSRPAFAETWDGTKSWRAAAENEVRLQTPVPVRGLDLRIYLKGPVGDKAVRSLRGLCGRRRVTVPRPWPTYL